MDRFTRLDYYESLPGRSNDGQTTYRYNREKIEMIDALRNLEFLPEPWNARGENRLLARNQLTTDSFSESGMDIYSATASECIDPWLVVKPMLQQNRNKWLFRGRYSEIMEISGSLSFKEDSLDKLDIEDPSVEDTQGGTLNDSDFVSSDIENSSVDKHWQSFSDEDFLGCEDARAMLDREGYMIENEFRTDLESPFGLKKRQLSSSCDEKILLSLRRGTGGMVSPLAHLHGIAYELCYVAKTKNNINFHVSFRNFGKLPLSVELKTQFYKAARAVLSHVCLKPNRFVLKEEENKKICVSFTCLDENVIKENNLPGFGYLLLKCRDDFELMIKQMSEDSPFRGFPDEKIIEDFFLKNNLNLSKFSRLETEEWSVSPPELVLNASKKTGRFLLINNSEHKLKFRLRWETATLSISPIEGTLPANGDLGLRVNLQRKANRGNSNIEIFCGNSLKNVAVRIMAKQYTQDKLVSRPF